MIFTVEQTQIRSEWPPQKTLKFLGIPKSNYYRWRRERSLQDRRGRIPSLDRVLPEEEQAVIAYALKHPQEGYRRLSWMMVDEDVAYLCPSTVYRILDRHDLLYRWKRTTSSGTKPPEPKAADERWHIDILYLWVMSKWYFLVTILDGFSRYIVHWRLLFSMAAEEVVDVVEEALEKLPDAKPEVVSDCGSQFTGREFRQLINAGGDQDPQTASRVERTDRALPPFPA